MKRRSTQPEQLRIAYGDDPTTTMTVVWQTTQPTQKQVVEYGTTRGLGMRAEGTRPTYPYETGAIAEVRLSGLRPGTTYYYRVGDPDGGWSGVHAFRTGDLRPKRFAFTAFGDHGIAADSVKNVQNILAERPAFHLLLGDVSYANGNQPVWDDYLHQIEPLARTTPFMLTLGNHENEKLRRDGQEILLGYISYLARFGLPGGEKWYSFDYGPARFVAFNSDDYTNLEQLAWLERTLTEARSNPAVGWVIVFQHHPLYGSSKGRGDNPRLIQTVAPLYDRYRVDLVLCGHDHHYERQFPLRNGQAVTDRKTDYRQGEGTLYIVEGGGGKSLYDFIEPQPTICALREKTNGYLRFTVDHKQLVIEAKRIDRSRIETIRIRRP
jgi:hypothetical protein